MTTKKSIISLLLLVTFTSCSVTLRAQTITTIAGGGSGGGVDGWGDGLPASNAIFGNFCGIAFDRSGNLFIGDKDHNIVRKIDAVTGIISVVAGNGTLGYNGDSILAANAQLNSPGWLAFDAGDNLYISDRANHRIRRVDNNGIITTYAGNGIAAFSGDTGYSKLASLNSPQGICFDKYGALYIADGGNQRIRKVDAGGIIITIAGTGVSGFSGDSGPAINAQLGGIYGICTDTAGNIFVADWNNRRIRKIDKTTGVVMSVSGNGDSFYSTDNVDADSTGSDPFDVFADNIGNIFIADFTNNRIRKIDVTGIIHTIAGSGIGGFGGDGGNADTAKLYRPAGVTMDSCNNLYIADNQNKRIRKVALNPNCFPATVNEVNSTSSISIYPNPTKEQLTIIGSSSIKYISILNTLGQILIEQNRYSSKEAILNVSSLGSGVYFIKVSDENGSVVTKRFVKE